MILQEQKSLDQPIGGTGAHQRANIPNGTTYACDHIREMLPPTSGWGKNFVTVPPKTTQWRYMEIYGFKRHYRYYKRSSASTNK
ncbi:MAG: IgGFc-binding protein [Ignavibacteria bacterium]|nr:IgGFc-binding protein [Ignavibacteria bacterium]